MILVLNAKLLSQMHHPRKNPNVYEELNWRRLFRTDYWGLDMFEARVEG